MTRVVEKLGTAAADTSVRTGARVAHLAYRYDMTQPCRAKSSQCGAAGECLRCSADQGVACGDNDPFLNPSKAGTIFHNHTCYRCRDGELPCPHKGKERNCDTLRARND